MIDSDNQVNSNLKHWSIESVTGKSIAIQLNFERPLEVSQNNKSDQLFVHIRMSTWTTKDGRFLPELVAE